MKKFLVLAALALTAFAATDAYAVGGRMRTVGLGWATWTPQGPVSAKDTTTIIGATQTQDTTNVFDATMVDWNPIAKNDPNAANVPGFKLQVHGTFVSCDTITVTMQGSVDGYHWFGAKAATAFGVPTTHGNQNTIAAAYAIANVAGDQVSSANAALPWKYFRFIVKVDGNTAALMSPCKASVSYYVADDRLATAPRFKWEVVPFGTWAAGQFVAEKDTSSIAGTARDTTGAISWADYMLGPGVPVTVGGTAADSTIAIASLLVVQSSNASSNDSLYVGVESSPDGYTWQTTQNQVVALTNNAGYYTGAVIANTNNAGTAGAGFAINLGVLPSATVSNQIYQNTLFASPFTRFALRAGNGGEVAGGAKVWVGRWVAPGSELTN